MLTGAVRMTSPMFKVVGSAQMLIRRVHESTWTLMSSPDGTTFSEYRNGTHGSVQFVQRHTCT